MTTLVALSTCDALVMGCDSLGTFNKRLVDLADIVEYFDDDLNLKVKSDGKPVLSHFSKIYGVSQLVPYSHMTHVDKLFSLEPLKIGVMSAGEASIGDRSIKNLIGEFKSLKKKPQGKLSRKTITGVGKELLKFLWGFYVQEHPNEDSRPELELIMGGYDPEKYVPGIVRINVHENKMGKVDYEPGVFFGAQAKEIQRLVFGTDLENRYNLRKHSNQLLEKYRGLLSADLIKNGVKYKLKSPNDFVDELEFFKDWNLDGLDTRISAFSDQNAIECVDFLVNIMIKSQQFSAEMPTVGGFVQLAIIKKDTGFTWLSKRQWQHGDYNVPIKE